MGDSNEERIWIKYFHRRNKQIDQTKEDKKKNNNNNKSNISIMSIFINTKRPIDLMLISLWIFAVVGCWNVDDENG